METQEEKNEVQNPNADVGVKIAIGAVVIGGAYYYYYAMRKKKKKEKTTSKGREREQKTTNPSNPFSDSSSDNSYTPTRSSNDRPQSSYRINFRLNKDEIKALQTQLGVSVTGTWNNATQNAFTAWASSVGLPTVIERSDLASWLNKGNVINPTTSPKSDVDSLIDFIYDEVHHSRVYISGANLYNRINSLSDDQLIILYNKYKKRYRQGIVHDLQLALKSNRTNFKDSLKKLVSRFQGLGLNGLGELQRVVIAQSNPTYVTNQLNQKIQVTKGVHLGYLLDNQNGVMTFETADKAQMYVPASQVKVQMV